MRQLLTTFPLSFLALLFYCIVCYIDIEDGDIDGDTGLFKTIMTKLQDLVSWFSFHLNKQLPKIGFHISEGVAFGNV